MNEIMRVPTENIAAMLLTLFICFAIPIALAVFARKKLHADWKPLWVGVLIFLGMAYILESIFHQIILGSTGNVGNSIQNNIWLYAAYGGFMAALFEECGRLLAFRLILKKEKQDADGFMYGVGHGGIEAIMLIGMVYVNNLIISFTINMGALDKLLGTSEVPDTLQPAVAKLCTSDPALFMIAGAERIFAICLQIALSMLVFMAGKHHKKSLFILAFAIHFLVDAATVILSKYLSIYATEMFVMGAVIAAVILTWFIYRRNKSEQTA